MPAATPPSSLRRLSLKKKLLHVKSAEEDVGLIGSATADSKVEVEDRQENKTAEKRAAMSRIIVVVLLVISICAFPAAWFFFKRIKHTAFFYVAPPSLALGNIPLMVTAVAYQRLFKFLCAIAALKVVPGTVLTKK